MPSGFGESLVLKSAAQGAATQCYVAVHPDAATLSGRYFADCNVVRPREDGTHAKTAGKLWTVSEEIVARLP